MTIDPASWIRSLFRSAPALLTSAARRPDCPAGQFLETTVGASM